MEKSLKAKNIGLSLDVTSTNLGDNHLIPSELKTEICALKCLDGWGKVLDGIPLSFSSEHMIYFERINKKNPCEIYFGYCQ